MTDKHSRSMEPHRTDLAHVYSKGIRSRLLVYSISVNLYKRVNPNIIRVKLSPGIDQRGCS